jgi:glycolate oxidase FAD binding subunit
MPVEVCPNTVEEAGSALASATAAGQAVRIRGAGTKDQWGAGARIDVELSTAGLAGILEHNEGDLTAIVQAGAPLAEAQRVFAGAGQMLALDPWPGLQGQATMGGVLATADSGPLNHRYGAPRDLVLGMTVVLADGTVARSGGRVIKNVAGYDVAKLFCGSFGTLGLIASVNLRLHPLPEVTVTATGDTDDPGVLAEASGVLAAAPLELEALDVSWEGGRGIALARCGGASALNRARRVAELMGRSGLTSIEAIEDDEPLWQGQRARQRSSDAVVLRVAGPPGALAGVLAAARRSGAALVGRAALGLSYLTVAPEGVSGLLAALPDGSSWTLLDAPRPVRSEIDRWGPGASAPALALMRRVKARFDPTGTCNPGIFLGGI